MAVFITITDSYNYEVYVNINQIIHVKQYNDYTAVTLTLIEKGSNQRLLTNEPAVSLMGRISKASK